MVNDPDLDPAFRQMLERLDEPIGWLGYVAIIPFGLGALCFVVMEGMQAARWAGRLTHWLFG